MDQVDRLVTLPFDGYRDYPHQPRRPTLSSRWNTSAFRTVTVLVRSRCFHASATSAGRCRLLMPGWWCFEVGPEPGRAVLVPVSPWFAKVERERFETGVVQRGLAFAQVVHEQVAHGPTGQLVSVDLFLGGRCP